ncbi:retinol-binding protein pinta-like isoform X1 [Eriocheir sinensis]|uniref:retinol-binding protein pinta-like isoform X1 n=1 Tax=Eriocheir sinensis TaxID=95602 RepID=UPI0021C72BF4|nr:retinol-binding protein pinta-like isoform X1 [Eriocheir sinensis]XP_050724976.1 retinol-binding protein pinta-like isoform X1 [Eriocheir sinensis]XP_050724978.1 retinol-binding protein pinta-like isoform X1 [Eriocheir sinensis]XP_050724979.1 retinol-binding protein pinta-like isoform X1 [Eriocheir sinensis]
MGGDKYVCTLSPELLQRAKDEINEDPDRREADIEHIRDWLRHQPHINARMDDWTILRFLRGCKFSLERTKEKLDMFYTCKSLCPEWYKNRDPQDKKLRSILELGILLPLTGYDYMGRRVMLGRLGHYNPSKNSANMLFKALSMVTDCMLEEDEQASVTGYVAIGDNADMSLSHVYIFTPSIAKKAMVLWQVRRKSQCAFLGSKSLTALWDGRWGGHVQGYCNRVGCIMGDRDFHVAFLL